MAGDHYQRAHILFDQRRYDLAIEALGRALEEVPNDANAHALLAASLLNTGKIDEATRSAIHARQLDPTNGYAHYITGYALWNNPCFHRYVRQSFRSFFERTDVWRRKVIEQSFRRAIECDPHNPDYYEAMARLDDQRKRTKLALEWADRGLQLDPMHHGCALVRAWSLMKLGRLSEADDTVLAALSDNPEDSNIHTSRGWILLHSGKHKEALEHMSEGLRLNPDSDCARISLLEALRARVPILRWSLRLLLWNERMEHASNLRKLFYIGIFLLVVLTLIVLSVKYDIGWLGAAGLLLPMIVVGVFALSMWFTRPTLNLLILFHPIGRKALSYAERMKAVSYGATVLWLVVLFSAIIAYESDRWASITLSAGVLLIPLAAVVAVGRGPGRGWVCLFGALSLLIYLWARFDPEPSARSGLLYILAFVLGGATAVVASRVRGSGRWIR